MLTRRRVSPPTSNLSVGDGIALSAPPAQAPPLRICTSVGEAAESIRTHSFAVVRLNDDNAASMSNAWRSARSFFQHTYAQGALASFADGAFQGLLRRYRHIDSLGQLHGFNRPSNAKLLFRAICGEGSNQCQPWPAPSPSDAALSSFQQSSYDVAGRMHTLLLSCLQEITQQTGQAASQGSASVATDHANRRNPLGNAGDRRIQRPPPVYQKQPASKRRRVSATDSDVMMEEEDPTEPPPQFLYRPRQQMTMQAPLALPPPEPERPQRFSMVIPRTARDARYCPLDYFLYLSCGGEMENCSSHVDRGVLIVVSLTDVSGLEVLPRGAQEFVQPEELCVNQTQMNQRTPSGTCSDLVCIMAGDSLAEACESALQEQRPRPRAGLASPFGDDTMAVEQTADETYHLTDEVRQSLRPCVHRVKRQLERSRLSITYELRAN